MFINDIFKRILQVGQQQNMTDKQFLEREIYSWLHSPQREWQLRGFEYYNYNQAIDAKERTAIGLNGSKIKIGNLPNNKIMDNRYSFLVDQKANYLLSKSIDVKADNDAAQDTISDIFGPKFRRTIKAIGKDALNGGISYLFPYVDNGELKFKRFRSFEILPFWADDEHTQLDAFMRLYPQEVYEGMTKRIIMRAEWYTINGVQKYSFIGGELRPEGDDITPYVVINDNESDPNPKGYNWGRIPLIVFKSNEEEIPLIKRVKSLQDALNTLYSNFADVMQEDSRNTILVLHNYDGEDLGEMRQKLAQYGAVKVRDDGDVTTLDVAVNTENYKTIIDIIRKAIIENGRGLDTKDDRLASGAPNQMNIKSMYNDIDLDADDMEMEFQAGLADLMWFVNKYNATVGLPTVDAKFIFNRDTMTNESDTINNCKSSVGILSDETILENHPWVKDSKEEMERIKKEKQENISSEQMITSQYPKIGDKGGVGDVNGR